MKKYFLVLSAFLFFGIVFGTYLPSIQDQQLLNYVDSKVITLNQTKKDTIHNKLSQILPTFNVNSREYYILNYLLDAVTPTPKIEVITVSSIKEVATTPSATLLEKR